MRNIRFAILLALLIALGLGSRAYEGIYSDFVHLYIGDVLYATMYYLLFRWIGAAPKSALFYAIALCFIIEILQLYQAPWIEAIRATRLGGLILGFGFLWSDLVCYSLGGFLGFYIEKWGRSRTTIF